MSKNHKKDAEKQMKKDKNLKNENAAMTKEEGCTDECTAGGSLGACGSAAQTVAEPCNEKPSEKTCGTADGEKSLLEEAQGKITELEEKCKDWQEQYLRKAADFENYRKRMLREKQEAIDYANSNLLLDLVQVLDDFDRAIDAGKSSADKAFTEGVIMIKNQMVSMLGTKYGLAYYPAKGEKFDPNIHEAISMIQSQEVKEPTVGEEIQKGYKLKDRIIRTSKVMVLMPAEKQTENKSDAAEKEAAKTDGADTSAANK